MSRAIACRFPRSGGQYWFGKTCSGDREVRQLLRNPPQAITGDIVRAKIVNREQREGRTMSRGKITEILQRTQKRFVGTLARTGNEWMVHPDAPAAPGYNIADAEEFWDRTNRQDWDICERSQLGIS